MLISSDLQPHWNFQVFICSLHQCKDVINLKFSFEGNSFVCTVGAETGVITVIKVFYECVFVKSCDLSVRACVK